VSGERDGGRHAGLSLRAQAWLCTRISVERCSETQRGQGELLHYMLGSEIAPLLKLPERENVAKGWWVDPGEWSDETT
jgi:hypothetical protein